METNHNTFHGQQYLELTPTIMPDNSPLDPNFIALPIFQPAINNTALKTRVEAYRETHYSFGKHYCRVRFHSEKPLRRLDRTILSLIEIFYSYQNPNCETEYAFFSFSDIRRLLGKTSFNTKQYKDSLLRLHNTHMELKWVIKDEEQTIEKINEYLNLISEIRIISFKDADAQRENNLGPTSNLGRTDVVRVKLSSIHIQNIQNGMVRYLPVDKILQVKNNTAGLLIYWISAFGYQKNKDKKPAPVPNFTVDYQQICRYLYFQPRKQISAAKQQFSQALNELQEKGVLSEWKLYENSNREYKIKLQLKAFDEWEDKIDIQPKQKRSLPKKLQKRLINHGITEQQIQTISLMEETVKGIEDKVDQLEWLLEYEPHKIKNKNAARYLYKSIADNWIDSGYKNYKAEVERKRFTESVEEEKRLQITFAWKQKEEERSSHERETLQAIEEGKQIAAQLTETEHDDMKTRFIESGNRLVKELAKQSTKSELFMTKYYEWLSKETKQ